jgi:hypothetical protein
MGGADSALCRRRAVLDKRVAKILDFEGSIAEVRGLIGLEPAVLFAVLVILTCLAAMPASTASCSAPSAPSPARSLCRD